MARILLLDDENEFVDACARTLKKLHQIVKTGSPFEAISFLDAGRMMIDLTICDFNMPGMNGLEFLNAARKIGIKTPMMLLTGAGIEAHDPHYGGFAKVISKPFSGEKLLAEVNEVLGDKATGEISAPSSTHLAVDSVLSTLRQSLRQKGVEFPESIDPDQALKLFGPGETNDWFMALYYLERARKSL